MLSIHPRLPMVLAMIAGAAMLAVTSWQGYRFWQTESQPTLSAAGQAAQQSLPSTRDVPAVDLANVTLFGSPNADSAPAELDTENLPETNLRLFLRGVLAASGEFPGSALIEDDKSKTEVYLVGDELPGNATLRSVFPNRVIIERSGKLENLYFPEEADRSGMSFTTDDQAQQADTAASGSTGTTTSPTTPSADQQRREEIRRRLEQLRERLRNNN
ncbi:type II secretion system protein N [Marinobacter sp. DUT-1]|uniref:type II secretion system protein N n=1 Tax=Marinobacter sp. DUT-1 TaxID=3412037 RepID=UPI003D1670F8